MEGARVIRASNVRPGVGRLAWLASLLCACAASIGSLSAATERFKQIADGIAVAHDELDEPWSVHILRIDRSHKEYSLVPALAFHDRIGLNQLSEQMGLFPKTFGTPVGAINGDFYATEHEAMPGDPRGLFITRGEMVSAPIDRDCFWFTTNGEPRIGTITPQFTLAVGNSGSVEFGLNEDYDGTRTILYTPAAARMLPVDPRACWVVTSTNGGAMPPLGICSIFRGVVKGRAESRSETPVAGQFLIAPDPVLQNALKAGAPIRIDTATEPSLAGVTTALGGGPALVRNGKVVNIRVVKSRERHPRSALGWNATHFFLAVVDGRQPGLSVGMSLPELAAHMRGLGCTEAMNLDGGGSTELIFGGRILNSPCFGRERSTSTSLLLVRQPAPLKAP